MAPSSTTRFVAPAVLLIMGASGDGGHFHGLVQLLADEYTVVTYDRRGNGRSPRPPGWNTTSNDEQASRRRGTRQPHRSIASRAFASRRP
jgi:pimeloyl-ACP methyl ester carboxylesterase